MVTIESRTQYVLTEAAATEKEAVVVVLVLLHPKHTPAQ